MSPLRRVTPLALAALLALLAGSVAFANPNQLAPTAVAAAAPAMEVGVVDRNWLDNDRAAQAILGYRRIRMEGSFAGNAAYYASKGIKGIALVTDSTDWRSLRDTWLAYGPNGTAVRGVVDHLELGNEEAYAHRTADPYGAGRIHGDAVRRLKGAVPDAKVICQGDDGNRGLDAFFRGMRRANASIARDCDKYSIHPFGPGYAARMTRNRGYINNILGDSQAKFAVTEWGLSVRLDQGCVSDNYGWPTCMTHSDAATVLRDFVAYLRGRGDVSLLTYFQNTDQITNDPNRERNFGLLSSYATALQRKGALTQAAIELIAG